MGGFVGEDLGTLWPPLGEMAARIRRCMLDGVSLLGDRYLCVACAPPRLPIAHMHPPTSPALHVLICQALLREHSTSAAHARARTGGAACRVAQTAPRS